MNSKNTHSICKIIFLGLAIYLVVTNLFTSSIIEGEENMVDDTMVDDTMIDDTMEDDTMGDYSQTALAETSASDNLNYSIAPNQTGNPVRHMTGGVRYIPKNVMRVPDVVSGDITNSSIAPNSEVLSNTVFHNGQYQSINSLETQPMLQTTPKYAY